MRTSHRRTSVFTLFLFVHNVLLPGVGLAMPQGEERVSPVERPTVLGTRSGASAGSNAFTGAATVVFPIRVPPGNGAIEPQLSLRYSSHERIRTSWVGAGWSLGVGEIKRSLREGVPTYDDAVDTFMFLGQNLVESTPGTYHTRIESFQRIRFFPYGWEVGEKDGTVSRYGYQLGAQGVPIASENCALKNGAGDHYCWLLCEREDVHGNKVVAIYDHSDVGTAYLQRLDYGSSDGLNRSVEFALENRPDARVSYLTGFERESTQRLAEIQAKAGGELVFRYSLHYDLPSSDTGRSLLRRIDAHGSEPGSGASVRSTAFDYHSNADEGVEGWLLDAGSATPGTGWAPPVPVEFGDYSDLETKIADLNGDALPDLLKESHKSPSPSDEGAYMNTGTGFAAVSDEIRLPFHPDGSGQEHSFTYDPPPPGPDYISSTSSPTILIDLNRDGRADMLMLGSRSKRRAGGLPPNWTTWAHRALQTAPGSPEAWQTTYSDWDSSDPDWLQMHTFRGYNFGLNWTSGTPPTEKINLLPGRTALADLNGDGRPDLTQRWIHNDRDTSDEDPGVAERSYVLNTGDSGTGFSARLTDRFLGCTEATLDCELTSTKARYEFEPHGNRSTLSKLRLLAQQVDVNGDGLADHVAAYYTEDAFLPQTDWYAVYINNGMDYVRDDRWNLPVPLFSDEIEKLDNGVRFIDLNGDGLLDFYQSHWPDANRAFLNTGDPDAPWSELSLTHPLQLPEDPFNTPSPIQIANDDGSDMGVRFADLDGDGMVDILYTRPWWLNSTPLVFLNTGRVPDLLTQVTNRFGGTTNFEYTPSTQFQSGDPLNPAQQLPMVMQVVTEIETDDLQGNVGTTDITYEGGLFDGATREFRGFATSWTTEHLGASVTRTTEQTFGQQEWNLAQPLLTEVLGSDGALRRTQFIYVDPPPLAPPPFVTLPERIETLEQDGSDTRETVTNVTYDDYGNLLTLERPGETLNGIDQDLSDTRTRRIEYTYADTSTLYLVNRPKLQQIETADAGSGVSIALETEFYYDGNSSSSDPPTLGNLTKRVEVLAESGKPDPTTTFAYDNYGNLSHITGPRENAGELASGEGTSVIEYEPTFDAFPSSATNGLGHRSEFGYSEALCPAGSQYPVGSGQVQVIKDPNVLVAGGRSFRCYDHFGRVTSTFTVGFLGSTTTTYTDTPGSIAVDHFTHYGAESLHIESLFDGMGREIQTTDFTGPQGSTVVASQTYDQAGRLASSTLAHFAGGSGATTSLEYDSLDRVVTRYLPSAVPQSRFETISYAAGVVTATDANGNAAERTFDPFGNLRIVKEHFAPSQAHVTSYTYDVRDNLLSVAGAAANTTGITYDRLGRRLTLDDPNTGLVSFEYDAGSNVTKQTDVRGVEVVRTFDALDRPLTENHSGGPLADNLWTYDTAPNGIGLLHVEVAGDRVLELRDYDLLSRPKHVSIMPTPSTVHHFHATYDTLGQVLTRTHPTGRVVEREYDDYGHLTAIKTGPDYYATGIEFDALGRVTQWVSGNAISNDWSYDPGTARLDEIVVQGSTLIEHLEYQYDDGDRLQAINDLRNGAPDLDRTFQYDPLNRLTQATGPFEAGYADVTWNYEYDGSSDGGALGNLTCMNATNDAGPCSGASAVAMAYPSLGNSRPHAPDSVTSGGVVRSPTYDAAGGLTVLPEADGTWTYAYNGLGQLESAKLNGAVQERFWYDGVGDLATIEDSSSGATKLRHFLAGDFEWHETDELGRIHVQLGPMVIATHEETYIASTGGSCGVGAELVLLIPLGLWLSGRTRLRRPRRRAVLAAGTAAVFAWHATDVPLWLMTSNAHAAGPASGVVYYHPDHLGSSTIVTDESGAVIQRALYRPFGEVVPAVAGGSTDAPEFGFTGQRYETGIGIYDYGARWYHPRIAHFLQPDSFVTDAADPQTFNRYGYVANDPLNRIDPTGNLIECAAILGIVIWAAIASTYTYLASSALEGPTRTAVIGPASPESLGSDVPQGNSNAGLPDNDPLPNSVKEILGSYFPDTDLDEVRVKTGVPWYVPSENPATDGKNVAYTQGNTLYFEPGYYDTESASGLALIGHELTHVRQQNEHGLWTYRRRYLFDGEFRQDIEDEAGEAQLEIFRDLRSLGLPR